MRFIEEVIEIEREYDSKIWDNHRLYSSKINDLKYEEELKEEELKREQWEKVNRILNENVKFIKGEMLYFECVGSGYYGRFDRIENNMIYMDVCTKGGKDKGVKFERHIRNFLMFDRLDYKDLEVQILK